MFDSRRIAATLIACTVVLSGSWVYTAHAQPDSSDVCVRAVDLGRQLAAANNRASGTQVARSAALNLGLHKKVADLTPRLATEQAERYRLHVEFHAAAADCD